MKSKTLNALVVAAAAGMSISAFGATITSFTPGDLVIYRIGDGSAAPTSSSTAIFLDEYTPAGVLVGSLPMPTASGGGNNPLTSSGTATSEGGLTLSENGQVLLLTGYDSAPGSSGSIASTTAASVPREVGEVDANANINTTTTLGSNFSANNPRSVASVDGSNIYVAGANTGVLLTTLGSTGNGTVVASSTTNLRQLKIFNDQLYTSSASGSLRLGTVGSGLPTSTGSTITNLSGFPTSGSPYSYFFADLSSAVPGLDTLYVADDGAAANGTIEKFSLVGGSWVANGTIVAKQTFGSETDGVRGLTGAVDPASGSVTLFATTGAGAGANAGGQLWSLTDTSGYDATITGTLNALASAGTNEMFRGVAFAPTPEPSSLGLLALAALMGARRRRS